MTDRIERELLLSSSPSDTWRALTDPARLELWLADEVTLDLRPGGDAHFRFGDAVREGWIEEVSPPSGVSGTGAAGGGRLAFWWAQPDEPASRVEFTLAPLPGGGTRLQVCECRPLELEDLLGTPLPRSGGRSYGPALVALTA